VTPSRVVVDRRSKDVERTRSDAAQRWGGKKKGPISVRKRGAIFRERGKGKEALVDSRKRRNTCNLVFLRRISNGGKKKKGSPRLLHGRKKDKESALGLSDGRRPHQKKRKKSLLDFAPPVGERGGGPITRYSHLH